jgi:hypothetical protein
MLMRSSCIVHRLLLLLRSVQLPIPHQRSYTIYRLSNSDHTMFDYLLLRIWDEYQRFPFKATVECRCVRSKPKISTPRSIGLRTLLCSPIHYFMLVFGAGCILHSVRVLVLEPNLGKRYAELLELILMIMVIKRAARGQQRNCKTGQGHLVLRSL